MIESTASKVETIFGNRTDMWLVTALVVLVMLGYGATLNFFFTADDLWQVHYAYRIFNGDTDLLWRNFIGNYIQIPGFEFYRPLLGLTFWFDYLLGKTNPFVYHVTSTVLYAIDVVLLFGLVKRLVASFATGNALAVRASAFTTAAMFAVNPLHCEAVTWLSGRADVLSAVFYLVTLNLVHDGINETSVSLKRLALASVTFVLALGAKEIAVGLPIVVFTLAVLKPNSRSLQSSLKTAFKVSLPFLLIAAAYLAFRHTIFGSMFGGYTGSFGLVKAKYASMLWFDPQVWMRIIFPFNGTMLKPLGVYEIALLIQLVIGGLLCAVRVLTLRNFNWRLAAFLALWSITLLVPLATVWGLDPARHNSRLLFFLTMPLSALIPCCLFAWKPNGNGDDLKTSTVSWKVTQFASYILFGTMTALLLCATAIMNQAWRTAGSIVDSIRTQCSALTSKLGKDEKIVVLGIPDDHKGAMVILNGSTLHHLLSPPFCERNVFEQVESFKPFLVGPGDLIDSSRFKKLMRSGTIKGVYAWNEATNELELVPLIDYKKGVQDRFNLSLEQFESVEPGYYANLKLNPPNVDFLMFDLVSNTRNNFTPITLWWNDGAENRSKGMIRLLPAPAKTPVTIGLSDNWRWYASPEIQSLKLDLGRVQADAIRNARVVSANLLMPALEISTPARTTGEYVVKPDSIDISWDADSVKDATSVVLEVTKPNFFFGGSEILPPEQLIAHKQILTQTQGCMRLPKNWFTKEGFYELRIHAFDQQEKPVGEFSQAATIYSSESGSTAYLD